jgi:chemotaxis protein MotB
MANDRGQIIIKKVKKGGHDGHHGGAWKVAYADFVTAMMAFFLLLWLLSATTEEQKLGIADYFAPSIVTGSAKGADGVLGGNTLTVDGTLKNDRAPIGITIALPSSDEEWDGNTLGIKGGDGDKGEEKTPEIDPSELDRKTVDALLEEQEQRRFDQAEKEILRAIEEDPALKNLAANLQIDHTPEGMRIQIVDKNKTSMFPSGSAQMYGHTRELLRFVVGAIADMENRIAIKGHTDATPYQGGGDYTNWELSTDRANASRRALIGTGLASDRIESVVGRAAEDPFIEEDPYDPQNRRISIILLRQQPLVEIPDFEDGEG